ncbi:MAG: hypothetical protein R3338_02220 [Thermoanaerobaculia bacterium]|nr:hypothetical protein [Thermoanaerobaculia bacterium]
MNRLIPRPILIALLVTAIGSTSCDTRLENRRTDSHGEDEIEQTSISRDDASLDPRPDPGEGVSGMVAPVLDPRHGGVVKAVDVYFVEVVPEPLEVWLYDRHGSPVAMEGIEGQIVVYTEEERHPHSLSVEGSHLSPPRTSTLPAQGTLFVELTIGERPLDVAFTLPLNDTAQS